MSRINDVIPGVYLEAGLQHEITPEEDTRLERKNNVI